MDDDQLFAMISMIAAQPDIGDLIKGTGGARKVRFPIAGKGKSGGYRIITYYTAPDIPVFLMDMYAKGERITLTKAERNELHLVLSSVADDYRQSMREKVTKLNRGSA